MPILQVNILEAGYEARQAIVRDVNFAIYPNELVGMIGSNGAGQQLKGF